MIEQKRKDTSSEFQEIVKTIPLRWYESTQAIKAITYISCLPMIYFCFEYGIDNLGNNVVALIGSLCAYLIGSYLDTVSTKDLYSICDQMILIGYNPPIYENNPLAKNSEFEELLRKGRMTPSDFLGMIFSITPPIGVGFGIGRTIAALNNRRLLVRMEILMDQINPTAENNTLV